MIISTREGSGTNPTPGRDLGFAYFFITFTGGYTHGLKKQPFKRKQNKQTAQPFEVGKHRIPSCHCQRREPGLRADEKVTCSMSSALRGMVRVRAQVKSRG